MMLIESEGLFGLFAGLFARLFAGPVCWACLLGLFAELFAGLLAMWNRNYVANVLIHCVKCDDEFVTS